MRTMWLFIDKTFICSSNGLLKLKIWTGHLIETSQNGKIILIHIPNLLLGLNI